MNKWRLVRLRNSQSHNNIIAFDEKLHCVVSISMLGSVVLGRGYSLIPIKSTNQSYVFTNHKTNSGFYHTDHTMDR
jgi:hypothetical protein